jgi:hypothetical protein
LAKKSGGIIVVATFDDLTIFHAHYAAISNFHLPASWFESAETRTKWACMCATIDKLYYCPISIHNYFYDFAFTVWKCLSPPIVVGLICFRTDLKLPSGNVFKLTIFRDYSCTSIRISHIPGLMPHTHSTFSFIHSIFSRLNLGHGVFCNAQRRVFSVQILLHLRKGRVGMHRKLKLLQQTPNFLGV